MFTHGVLYRFEWYRGPEFRSRKDLLGTVYCKIYVKWKVELEPETGINNFLDLLSSLNQTKTSTPSR